MDSTSSPQSFRWPAASALTFLVTLCAVILLTTQGQRLSTSVSSYDKPGGGIQRDYYFGLPVVLMIVGGQLGVSLGVAGLRRGGRGRVLAVCAVIANALILAFGLATASQAFRLQ